VDCKERGEARRARQCGRPGETDQSRALARHREQRKQKFADEIGDERDGQRLKREYTRAFLASCMVLESGRRKVTLVTATPWQAPLPAPPAGAPEFF
jgi:hypothetical protein